MKAYFVMTLGLHEVSERLFTKITSILITVHDIQNHTMKINNNREEWTLLHVL